MMSDDLITVIVFFVEVRIRTSVWQSLLQAFLSVELLQALKLIN